MMKDRKWQWKIMAPLGAVLLLASSAVGCGKKPMDIDENDPNVGLLYYRIGEFKLAENAYKKELHRADISPDRRAFLMYSLGALNISRTDNVLGLSSFDDGKKTLEELIKSYPQSEYAGWAMLLLGRYEQFTQNDEQLNYDNARKIYQNIQTQFPDSNVADEAFLFEQSTYVYEGKNLRGTADKLREKIREIEDDIERTNDPKNPDSFFTFAEIERLCYNETPVKEMDDLRLRIGKKLETHHAAFFLPELYRLLYTDLKTIAQEDLSAEEQEKLFLEVQKSQIMACEFLKSRLPNTDLTTRYWEIACTAQYKRGDFHLAKIYFHRIINEYPKDILRYSAEVQIQSMDKLTADLKKEFTGKEAAK